LIWGFGGLFLVSMLSEEWMQRVRRLDDRLSIQYLGPTKNNEIKKAADEVFARLSIQPKHGGTASPRFSLTDWIGVNAAGREDTGLQGMFAFLANRLTLLGDAIYRTIRRGLLVMAFGPFLLAALVPFLVDGVMQRKIRQSNFDYPSPLAHRSSLYAILGVFVLLLIVLMLPFPVPPQTIPLLLIIIPWAANIHITNTQKRL
jgi:hypothetical protein